MAIQKGRAGIGARRMANKRYAYAAAAALISIAILFALSEVLPAARNFGTVGQVIIILAAVAIIKYVSSKSEKTVNESVKRAKDADQGAEGEEAVGAILASLPEDFAVFHDVTSGYGNIDHIVISKSGGLFMIETKSHKGRITVKGDSLLRNGKEFEKDFINQAWRNAYWLRDWIKEKTSEEVPVTPVVVFSSAFVEVRGKVKGVTVINKNILKDTILKGKDRIGIPGLYGLLSSLEKKGA